MICFLTAGQLPYSAQRTRTVRGSYRQICLCISRFQATGRPAVARVDCSGRAQEADVSLVGAVERVGFAEGFR